MSHGFLDGCLDVRILFSLTSLGSFFFTSAYLYFPNILLDADCEWKAKETIETIIIEAIESFQIKNDLNQTEVGFYLGMSQQAISLLLKSRKLPDKSVDYLISYLHIGGNLSDFALSEDDIKQHIEQNIKKMESKAITNSLAGDNEARKKSQKKAESAYKIRSNIGR